MKPWIDRKLLIAQARDFVQRNGFFLRSHAKRISGLVEVAVYNSIVTYYSDLGYVPTVKNLGPKKSFRYKVGTTGLIENFSYFEFTAGGSDPTIAVLHNTKLQSAHDDHLYYTPDVAVCYAVSAVTRALKKSRKHSFIENKGLLCFIEVKHLVPFPEVLFSFTGLVQEFKPEFIKGAVTPDDGAIHLAPMIVFTGVPSGHAEQIREKLTQRYSINIVYGTQKTDGRIADFDTLNKYTPS